MKTEEPFSLGSSARAAVEVGAVSSRLWGSTLRCKVWGGSAQFGTTHLAKVQKAETLE